MKSILYQTTIGRLVLTLMLLSVAFNSSATDYYVSAAGNNSNSGTSTGSPWQTMSKVQSVINAGTIIAGDHIYFRRGDVFTGKMQITPVYSGSAHSGSSGSPIVIDAYGTGDLPIMQYPISDVTTDPSNRFILWFLGVDYWTIQNINFTDNQGSTTNDKYTPANNGVAIYLGFPGDGTCNHFVVQNNTISLCGLGVVVVGDYNTVTNCTMGNFRNLVSTSGGSDDYGANPLTIMGNNNNITHNSISSGWAESYDFGFNGGAFEMFNACNNNTFMYNTISDCGGISEFGANLASQISAYNVFAYNKIVNCGGLSYCNISGTFAINAHDNYWYNNVVVEDANSRFSGSNFGNGLFHSAAIANLTIDIALFQYNGSPSGVVNVVKNNIFQLSTGLNVYKHNDAHLTHTNNIFKLSGGGIVDVTPDGTESSTSSAIFTNTTASDPTLWNFYPLAGSPQIAAGTPLGLTPDFDGYTVASPPTIGPLEYRGLTAITTGTITPAGYCAGGSISVPFTVTGAANAGNTFTAQLSNSSGVFGGSPPTVGTLSSTTAGTISGTIPGGTTAGTGYYIRVISSNPSITGSSYGPITISTVTPGLPGIITGPTNACLYFSSPATYSISAVTNATSYIWTLPTGATGSSTGTSINVTFDGSFVSGTTIGVQAVSFCGTSTTRTLVIGRLNPGSPAAISGAADVCAYLSGTPTVTYSTTSSNSQYFTWTLPTGASGTSTTNSIVVTYSGSFAPGNISVTASNGCATTGARTLAVFKIPKQPSVISGPTAPCAPSTGQAYSVTDLGYTYNWTAPTNGTITGGGTTASVTIDYNSSFTSGNVMVTATNACGTSTARTLAVTKCGPRMGVQGISTPLAKHTQDILSDAMYPNPSNGDFKIALPEAVRAALVKVEITNQLGKVVYRNNQHCNSGIVAIQLAGKLSSGVYLIRYTVDGQWMVKKLIIQTD